MPITFWIDRVPLRCLALGSLLAAGIVPCAGAAQAGQPAGDQVVVGVGDNSPAHPDDVVPLLKLTHKAGKPKLEIRTRRTGAQSLRLETDAGVNTDDAAAKVELVASVSGRTLLIVDTWASRAGPLSMCQAGQETYLRVIRMAPAKEILRQKLASCRENMELATPGLVWQAETRTLTIRWLSGPDRTGQEKKLVIDGEGKATFLQP